VRQARTSPPSSSQFLINVDWWCPRYRAETGAYLPDQRRIHLWDLEADAGGHLGGEVRSLQIVEHEDSPVKSQSKTNSGIKLTGFLS
jgi:hypothetical protein